MLPPSVEGITVLPLPKYHPSPLAPLPPWKPPQQDTNAVGSPDTIDLTSDEDDGEDHAEGEDTDEAFPDFHEALAYGGDPNAAMGAQFPALAFYTSENQFVGRVTADDLRERNAASNQDTGILDHVIGGTTAVVSGVFGTALGVVKWGFGHADKVRICASCDLLFRIAF